MAIPFGFIGVIASLFVFGSTLSLNSILGAILLNGIAVNNSIMLVDLTKRLYGKGLSALEASIGAARQRLRPILITTLTTGLAMLPIALGYGEGGRVLSPLGIAVAGGLWVSTGLTLFLVPAFHTALLRSLENRSTKSRGIASRVIALGAESGARAMASAAAPPRQARNQEEVVEEL